MITLNGLCIVEISADSCANCHTLLPYLNGIAEENALKFIRIDLETYPDAAEQFAIEKVPAVLLCDGDKVFAKCYGYQPEEILGLWVRAKLEEHEKE